MSAASVSIDTPAFMGFDHFALAFDRRGTGDPASILVHNYPDAWAKVYVGFDLSGTDPIRRASERSLTGFEWRHVDRYIPLSRGDRQLLCVARESGVGDGFTVPRHLPGEASGTCSFAVGPHAAIPAEMLHAAEILGAIAIASARELIGSSPLRPRPTLTERQRECVLWSARGKTAGERRHSRDQRRDGGPAPEDGARPLFGSLPLDADSVRAVRRTDRLLGHLRLVAAKLARRT